MREEAQSARGGGRRYVPVCSTLAERTYLEQELLGDEKVTAHQGDSGLTVRRTRRLGDLGQIRFAWRSGFALKQGTFGNGMLDF